MDEICIGEVAAEERTPELVGRLVDVWERSVVATHAFLSADEVAHIKEYVPQALVGVGHLVVAWRGEAPVGFMGVEGASLEMLFLAPEERGHGLGRRFIELAISDYGVCELAVNEQNPSARGFYERMGFAVVRRTETDEQGGPYPLLYMRREAAQD